MEQETLTYPRNSWFFCLHRILPALDCFLVSDLAWRIKFILREGDGEG